MEKKKGKKKKFLKLPEYPGGKEAFKKYIKENLRYPEKALENKIEGTVYLEYRVSDTGKVYEVEIINGIGYGCDEEAVRLISNLKYGKTRNRGLRVTSKKKARIKFDLPKKKVSIKYNYKSSKKDKPDNNTITYTINL